MDVDGGRLDAGTTPLELSVYGTLSKIPKTYLNSKLNS